MITSVRHIIKVNILFLLCVFGPTIHGKEISQEKTFCPIGFTLFYKKDRSPICYRRKGPESFWDKYKDCAGNLFSSKLYNELNFSKSDNIVWTEFKSSPGGVFTDWSYTKVMGEKIPPQDIVVDPSLGLEEELCVVLDPVSNYTAVKCHEKYYSYCVVKPYRLQDEMTSTGCEGLKDSIRFWSPQPTCMTVLTGVGGGGIRATWNQAQDLCARKGGSLLNRGWRYANYPPFQPSGMNYTYPLGIIMSTDFSLLRYDATSDHSEISSVDWHFEDNLHNTDTLLGALHNDFWHLVNSSFIFYNVICERSMQPKNISLIVANNLGELTLTVNDSLEEDEIMCFTDSVRLYPDKVSKKRIGETTTFILTPKQDGYYWCTHTNSKKYKIRESNKVLFIRGEEAVINVFAIKFKHRQPYTLESLSKLKKVWEMKLKEYIYYQTKYEEVFGEINPNVTQDVLKGFKYSNPGLDWKEKSIILNMKLKRLYFDRHTVLVHVELNPDMRPVTPGFWDSLEILYMKPAYHCEGFDSISSLHLGQSTTTVGCRTHTCVGDFTEGVQWVTTAANDCTAPVHVGSSLRFQSVTLRMPTLLPTIRGEVPNLRDDTSESSEETTERYTNDNDTTLVDEDAKKPKPTPNPNDTCETDINTTIIIIEEVTTVNTPNEEVSTVNTPTEEVSTVNTLPEEVTTVDTPTEEVTTVTTPTDEITDYPTTTLPMDLTTDKISMTTANTSSVPSTTSVPITRPPEEQLQQVINDLDKLLSNDSATIMVDDIGDVFNEVDNLLEVHDSLEIPGQLLHLLDKLGSSIELNGSRSASAVRGNIALLMADAEPSNPVRGLRIAARDSDIFTDDAFQFISEEPNSTVLDSDATEAVVNLPLSVSQSARRISFVVFRNDRAFHPRDALSVNSRVLSVKVQDITQFEDGEVIDIHLSPIVSTPDRNYTRSCAYWQFLENGTGFWSQEGCTFIRASTPGTLDTCRCTHLTHFAEVLFPRAVFSQANEDALELLTIIGCCLSIFGLIMVGVTAAMFRSWRRDYSNKIWLQLCVAIFLLNLSFLIIIFAKFDNYNIFCMLIGVGLHYAVLASFCWMLVAAVLSYRRLVLVFTRDASHKLLRASAFSWGVPCAIIGILLSVAPHSYSGRFEEKTPTGSFCYPSGLALWLAVYAPIAAILLANWTLFALIVRSVFASRGIQRHGDSNEALRCASVSCLLVFLFGLPWVFGLFAFNVVLAYMFTLTATYQGFILFFFFVLGNKKTRDLWLNKLKIKQTRKVPVTSSTYSNRSTGWRVGTQHMTFEAKSSKPKSLTQDDSRFS